jgi:hypothetical protein
MGKGKKGQAATARDGKGDGPSGLCCSAGIVGRWELTAQVLLSGAERQRATGKAAMLPNLGCRDAGARFVGYYYCTKKDKSNKDERKKEEAALYLSVKQF